ncbi:MAG: hypothetical protein ACREBU_12320 [Nitrososphaera sp.]
MPLLKDEHLTQVVELLDERGVFFYHACQLKDFRTYLQLGGIPSRNLMERSRLPYTAFETDSFDHNNGVWTKVFGNLTDFGAGFAHGKWEEETAPTPNPYGPILLVAKPQILLKADDFAICLRSAGGRNFDRAAESLVSREDVDRLFRYDIDAAPSEQSKAYIKYSGDLRREFANRYGAAGPTTLNPEISCTVEGEHLPLDDLHCILTDKYRVGETSLGAVVARVADRGVAERSYRDSRHIILSDLANMLAAGTYPLQDIAISNYVSPSTRDWARRLIAGGLEWQYRRFSSYLMEGTLSELLK